MTLLGPIFGADRPRMAGATTATTGCSSRMERWSCFAGTGRRGMHNNKVRATSLPWLAAAEPLPFGALSPMCCGIGGAATTKEGTTDLPRTGVGYTPVSCAMVWELIFLF